jgi:glutaredoxin
VTVRIYIKPRCSLCEEAREVLEGLRTRVAFVLEVVDIRDHPDTWERYRHAVPVITLDGVEIARLRVDPVALASRLRGTTGA